MKKNIILILGVLSIVLACNTLALGISPGRKETDFAANQKEQMQITIYNTDKAFFKAVVYAEGEYAEYITLEKSLISFTDQDEKITINYEIDYPSTEPKPGMHETRIIAMELPEESKSQGTVVAARVAVVSKLIVRVPYPGKYAEAKLRAEKSSTDESMSFYVEVFNYGFEDIANAKATISIYGPTNEKIATIHSDEKSIKSKEKKELTAKWLPEVSEGKYHATAIVDYDGRIASSEADFQIGEGTILIKDLFVNNFRLGQIAKIDILLENTWTDYLRDIIAEVTVRDANKTYATFKINHFTIAPLDSINITSYWDTAGINVGQYYADVVLHYSEKTIKKTFNLVVSLDRIETVGIGRIIAGSSLEKEQGDSIIKSVSLLTILVGLLLVVNVYVFYKLIKKK